MVRPGTLFFAYGSLMDPELMAAVTGVEVAPGHGARVEGWRLAFNVREPDGSWVAGLVPAEGGRAYGAVYRVPRVALKALDRYEGVPDAYRRATLWVEPMGRPARQAALAYVPAAEPGREPPDDGADADGAPDMEGVPGRAYLEALVRGATLHGLPPSYIEWIRAKGRGEPVGDYEDAPES